MLLLVRNYLKRHKHHRINNRIFNLLINFLTLHVSNADCKAICLILVLTDIKNNHIIILMIVHQMIMAIIILMILQMTIDNLILIF